MPQLSKVFGTIAISVGFASGFAGFADGIVRKRLFDPTESIEGKFRLEGVEPGLDRPRLAIQPIRPGEGLVQIRLRGEQDRGGEEHGVVWTKLVTGPSRARLKPGVRDAD